MPTKGGKHDNLPSHEEINQYWWDRGIPMSIMRVEIDDCFVCGRPRVNFMFVVERAHIDPDGGEGVENLHLLCRACHVESEVLTGEAYWVWYRYRVQIAAVERMIGVYMGGNRPGELPSGAFHSYIAEAAQKSIDTYLDEVEQFIKKEGL